MTDVATRLVAIAPDGAVTATSLQGKPPSLQQLQKIVGGHIQMVPYFNRFAGEPCLAFCHEEGKFRGLPVNEPATALWSKATGYPVTQYGEYLVGQIAIVVGPHAFLESL
jgi:hypothetical protein